MTRHSHIASINPWPNGKGYDLTINGERFSLLADREQGRLIAFRLNDGGKITHSCRIYDDPAAIWWTDLVSLADQVLTRWLDHREEWSDHAPRPPIPGKLAT